MLLTTMVTRRGRASHYPDLELEKHPDDDSSARQDDCSVDGSSASRRDTKLVVAFCLLVIFGTGNVVFGKLQAVPMYNYPNFLNLFGLALYVPLCFIYIVPVSKFGWFQNSITPEQWALPKRPFAVMGCLDCLATLMQIFASVYLPGPLLILLPQAAIPISMLLSRYLLGERYRAFQYVGAVIVLVGILVVLEPMMTHRHAPDYICQAINEERDCSVCRVETNEEACLSHRLDVVPDFMTLMESSRMWDGNSTTNDDDEGVPICQWVSAAGAAAGEEWFTLIWCVVMIFSCIPMTLSSIYKEIALGDGLELDPIYMSGWISIFQFFISIFLAVPAGMASSPPVEPAQLPLNVYEGFLCYIGIGSIKTGCHPDTMCSLHAALFVNLALLMNIFYNLLMMFILKWGSASLLYVALTVMVPLGNLAFALPFMPQQATFHFSDLLGLAVIMSGLVLYRFADRRKEADVEETESSEEADEEDVARRRQLREPLLTGEVGDV